MYLEKGGYKHARPGMITEPFSLSVCLKNRSTSTSADGRNQAQNKTWLALSPGARCASSARSIRTTREQTLSTVCRQS